MDNIQRAKNKISDLSVKFLWQMEVGAKEEDLRATKLQIDWAKVVLKQRCRESLLL